MSIQRHQAGAPASQGGQFRSNEHGEALGDLVTETPEAARASIPTDCPYDGSVEVTEAQILWAERTGGTIRVDLDEGEFDLNAEELREYDEDRAPGEAFVFKGASHTDPERARNPLGATEDAIAQFDEVERSLQVGGGASLVSGTDEWNEHMLAASAHVDLTPDRARVIDDELRARGVDRVYLDMELRDRASEHVAQVRADDGSMHDIVYHPNRVLNAMSDDDLMVEIDAAEHRQWS